MNADKIEGGDAPVGKPSSCVACGAVTEAVDAACPMCGSRVEARHHASLQHAVAWLVTAAVLYVPANTWAIMRTSRFGATTDSTIVGGVLQLWHHHSYLIASVIFFASVLVPLAKMMSLGWLCWIASFGYRLSRPQHVTLYRITELLGRWSMIDVCVVAVLVALVRLGALFTIDPGPAGLAFAGVVIATMLSAHAFDPRLIWDAIERREAEDRHA